MGTKINSNYSDLLTFTRASKGHALRPVSYGDELVTNGDFSTDSDWTKQSGWSISGGVAVSNNASGYNDIRQSLSLTASKLYRIDFSVSSYTSGAVKPYLGNSGAGDADVFSGNLGDAKAASAAGNYYGYFVFPAGQHEQILLRAQNGFVGSIDNISVKEVTFDQPDGTLTLFEHPDNVPRVEWDANRNRLGLLVEESRTNLITRSEDFSNSSWNSNKQGISVSTDVAVAPDGTLTADKLNETATTDTHRVGFNISSVGDAVFSFFAKAGERTLVRTWAFVGGNTAGAAFNLSTGTIVRERSNGAATIQYVGNGWYRCSCTVDAASANSVVVGPVTEAVNDNSSYAGEAGKGIYIWGAQLEEASFPTSYIKSNSGSTTTRSADVASIPVADFGYNQSAGTVVVEATTSNAENVSTSRRPYTLTGVNSQIGATFVYDNSVFDLANVAASDGKHATAFKNGSMAISNNGGSPRTSSATLDGDYSSADIIIGGYLSGTNMLNGHIKKLMYIPRRVTNAQLISLTE